MVTDRGLKTRAKVLEHAFRQFASNTYEKVSFSTLEKASGVCRGSMIHGFKNKENIFKEVLLTYVFNRYTVQNVPEYIKTSLFTFYNYFIEQCIREKESMLSMGIENLNRGLVMMEVSAVQHLPDFMDKAHEWYQNELQCWRDIFDHAVSTGEIKQVNIDGYALLFENCYLGTSYAGLTVKFGYDIDAIKLAFDSAYENIKL